MLTQKQNIYVFMCMCEPAAGAKGMHKSCKYLIPLGEELACWELCVTVYPSFYLALKYFFTAISREIGASLQSRLTYILVNTIS